MSMEADGPVPTIDRRQVRDPVALEERQEDLGPVVADARQQPERMPEPAPVPGHVEDAATGQDDVALDVDVEAEDAEQERLAARPPSQRSGERGRPVRRRASRNRS